MNTHSQREQKEADLAKHRISACENRDAQTYYNLCNRLGIEPELPDLYEQGQIMAQHIRPEIGGLETAIQTKIPTKKTKPAKPLIPLAENEMDFLTAYETNLYSDEYNLRLHFQKFKIGQEQDLSKYMPHQIHRIAEGLYKTYKKRENVQKK